MIYLWLEPLCELHGDVPVAGNTVHVVYLWLVPRCVVPVTGTTVCYACGLYHCALPVAGTTVCCTSGWYHCVLYLWLEPLCELHGDVHVG